MARVTTPDFCPDCGRPYGQDFANPIKGHCYGAWFISWETTDCYRIVRDRSDATPAPAESPPPPQREPGRR